MKRLAIAILLGALASPAFAAGAQYFVVSDTVGNCSSPPKTPGLKIVGDKGGYTSADAAKRALKDITKKCKGVVE